jgi:hypothetical protein
VLKELVSRKCQFSACFAPAGINGDKCVERDYGKYFAASKATKSRAKAGK